MKKTLTAVGVIAVAAVLCLVLVGCSAVPNGTYVDSTGLFSYEFSGNNVTIRAGKTLSVSYSGTYSVNKEGDKITFTFGDEDASKYSGEFSFAQDKSAGTVTIAGTVYTKKK